MFRLYSLSFAFLLTIPLAAAETHRLNWELKIEGADSVAALATDAPGSLYATGTANENLPLINSIRRSNSGTDIAFSDDGGASWKPLANLPALQIGAVAAVPSSPGTFLMGANDGVYKSTDNGSTWLKIFSGAPFTDSPQGLFLVANEFVSPFQVGSIVFDPTNPKIVYLCSRAFGVMKSTDGGAHWGLMNTGLPIDSSAVAHIDYLVIDPFHPQTLIAGLDSEAYRSDDGALSWQPIDLQVPNDSYRGSAYPLVAFDPKRENVLYSFPWYALYRSTDRGASWTKLPVPGSKVNLAVPDPSVAGTVYASSELGVFKSTDDGATWTSIGPKETASGETVWSIAIDPANPSRMLIFASAASWRTTDGGQTWTRMTLSRYTYSAAFGTGSRVIATAARSKDIYLFARNAAGETTLSSLFGGQGDDEALALAADASGNLYVAGKTTSEDLDTTENSAQRFYGGGVDGFVAKIAPNGVLLWTTYLGGAGADRVRSIAVAPDGSVAVAGVTASPDFAPLDSTTQTKVEQVFVARISADGSRVLSVRRLGGTGMQSLGSIALDDSGNVWIAGAIHSREMPVTADAIKSSPEGYREGFLAKFAPDGTRLYSTYLGGSNYDMVAGVALDANGNLYLAGITRSADFPTTPGAFQRQLCSNCAYSVACVTTGMTGIICSHSNDDIFAMKMSPDGKQIIWSTLIGGGCMDVALGVAVGPDSNVYILGASNSSPFPTRYPVESGPAYGDFKAVLVRLDSSGTALSFASNISLSSARTQQTATASYVVGVPDTSTPVGIANAHALSSGGVWFVGGGSGSVAQLVPADAPALAIDAVQNAFRLNGGPAAPGELLRVVAPDLRPGKAEEHYLYLPAPLPTEIGGTRLLFDGQPVPLMSVMDGTVVAAAPFSLTPGANVNVELEYAGKRSNTMRMNVVAHDPGLWSADGSGTGQAFAQNADGRMNSPDNPAAVGDLITIFFTGAGVTKPAVTSGVPAPAGVSRQAATVIVTIGESSVTAEEAGLIPGFITGLSYARVRVPEIGERGAKTPIAIDVVDYSTASHGTSQELTIAVQ